MNQLAISVENLGVAYRRKAGLFSHDKFWAIKDELVRQKQRRKETTRGKNNLILFLDIALIISSYYIPILMNVYLNYFWKVVEPSPPGSLYFQIQKGILLI